jgi:methionine--tRNA ligase beta chain
LNPAEHKSYKGTRLANSPRVENIKAKFKILRARMDGLLVTCMEVPFSDFMNLDIRVGKVEEATQVPESRNLLKLIVDFGSEKRQSVAGLLQYYKPEELVGKKFVFVLNLQRRKLMGIESQCIVLAAEDNEGNVILVCPEKDIAAGSKIR